MINKTFIATLLVFLTLTFVHGSPIDAAKKVELLSTQIHATDEQVTELHKVCAYIDENWNALMNQESSSSNQLYQLYQISENTAITTHPSAQEICIYLKGHSKVLGEGKFKKVYKAITYRSESEVAIAEPKSGDSELDCLTGYDSIITPNPSDCSSSDWSSSYWSSSDWGSSYWSSSYWSSSYWSSSYWSSSDWSFPDWNWNSGSLVSTNEAKILEKVQGCRGTVQLLFITYSSNVNNPQPLIVQKYYNGGDLFSISEKSDLSFKEQLIICHDLFLALVDIHSRDIVHLDIHPGNVLLQVDSSTQKVASAVFADFGLSQDCSKKEALTKGVYKQEDIIRLARVLSRVISSSNESESGLIYQPINELLDHAISGNDDAETIYAHLLDVIAEAVDEKDFQDITKNSMLTKKIKSTNGPSTVWW